MPRHTQKSPRCRFLLRTGRFVEFAQGHDNEAIKITHRLDGSDTPRAQVKGSLPPSHPPSSLAQVDLLSLRPLCARTHSAALRSCLCVLYACGSRANIPMMLGVWCEREEEAGVCAWKSILRGFSLQSVCHLILCVCVWMSQKSDALRAQSDGISYENSHLTAWEVEICTLLC